MSNLIASLGLAAQVKTAHPSPFSLKAILGNIPHDPASLVALVLCVGVVAVVLWAGHRKPKDESAEQ